MDQTDYAHIYSRWVDAWNGDFDAVSEIIADNFVFHREHGQPEIHGPAELRTLLEQSREGFSDLTFTTTVGPVYNNDLIAARNEATGAYKGGVPGATAKAGTEVTLTGIDLMRVQNGKIVECWHNGNDLNFMLQLGVVQFTKQN